jgi:nicotinamidase-related amidase/type 1 glutamine amidotransferase
MRSLIALGLVLFVAAVAAADPITVLKRSRIEDPGSGWTVVEKKEAWEPDETAMIVCDMWDSHHCLNAVRRAVEMAPRMNDVLKSARDRGVLIIHAPSSCMEAYQDHPGRKLAQSAPAANNLPDQISEWCRHIPAEGKGRYPIDQTDGGEDDDLADHARWHEKLAALGRNPKAPWKSQLALLDVKDNDAISDSGVEIWNLLESRGIKNVVLLGVHTNMCVLGRPFGLRQLSKNGKNVVLMRDMTDTMYNPAKWPYVSHYAGTELIVEHIEKFVAPSITSVDFLAGSPKYAEPFRFARDKRRIAMLIGEDEYKTESSLPAFVEKELKPLGFEVTIVHADSTHKNNFPGMAEAIENADLVFVSVRRRLPPKEQLDALRAHVAAGKPVVGIRTACHAWCLRDDKQNEAAAAAGKGVWPEFDPEVFGGHYVNHHGNGLKSSIAVAEEAKDHEILRGVDVDNLIGNGSLYVVRPLTDTTQPLLMGSVEGKEPEPVAWTNLAGPKQARVFNTTLGHIDDFQQPAFNKLLVKGITWAIADPYPTGENLDALLPPAGK